MGRGAGAQESRGREAGEERAGLEAGGLRRPESFIPVKLETLLRWLRHGS